MEQELFQQELDKQRDKLLKAISQGQKIDTMMDSPEWEFFFGWVMATKDRLTKRVIGENFINDHNGYLYTVAAIQAVDIILKGVEQFKRSHENALKSLNELREQHDR